MNNTKPVNPYFNKWLPIKETKVKNPDEIIIPSWVLSSFFTNYGVDEIELIRDKNPSVLRIKMFVDGKILNSQ